MQIPLDDIVIKSRIRKDLGDLNNLAASLKQYGQISPIVISRKNILIAGERRLEAARLLGWRTINVEIIDAPGDLAKLEIEVEENIQRRDFAPEELAEATKRLYRLKNPGFFRRLWQTLIRFFKKLFRIEET
ncbi:MAG: ParB N-terminal domain-containing protein [Treponema sp.]|jgi:ParB family chromosome partitioning protein|nr:ParB N-terminal domain-containing protein [Treponema sp.]